MIEVFTIHQAIVRPNYSCSGECVLVAYGQFLKSNYRNIKAPNLNDSNSSTYGERYKRPGRTIKNDDKTS